MKNKFILSLAVFFALLLAGGVFFFWGGEGSPAPVAFSFGTAEALKGWEVVKGEASVTLEEGLRVGGIKQEVFLLSPVFYLNTEEYPLLKVAAKADQPGATLQIFWLPQYQQNFDFTAGFSRSFSVLPGFRAFYFDFRKAPVWTRGISRLLFRISPEARGFTLREVSFFGADARLAVLSSGQGFFDLPLLTLRKVNRIPAPLWDHFNLLYGFYFLVFLAGLVGLIFWGIRFLQKKCSLGVFYLRVAAAVFGALLVSWLLLDLKFYFDYGREVYRDLEGFAFQSAGQKIDLYYMGPLSEFAALCQKEVPSRAKVSYRAPFEYQSMALRYLLLPLYEVDLNQAQYVIGFGVPKEQIKGFEPYRELEGQGWILKKRKGKND